MMKEQADAVVIGGGVIGVSLAYGLAKQNADVILLDKEDFQLTASRGNFGLVWVQGKGRGMPRYAEWSIEATNKWTAFAENLKSETGVDLQYRKTGGLEICLGEEEYQERVRFIEEMRKESRNGIYDCEMLSSRELQQMLPKIKLGEKVSGASFCSHDGFVNPLNLLKALHKSFFQYGGKYKPGQAVEKIDFESAGFRIQTEKHEFHSGKLVIAGGLGTTKLAEMIGIQVPVRPEKGQVLVTERTERVFPYATGRIRQNFDGSFMLGASNEDVGYDLDTTHEVLKSIAVRAIRVFPILKNLQLIRSWAALRVLTPDEKPIYVQSDRCPGGFAVTSHSGVSLASLHSSCIAEWIFKRNQPSELEVFHPRRFDVPQAV